MQFSWKNPLSALPVLLLLAMHAGSAWGLAGNVQFVIGDVKLINSAGQAKAVQKGAEVNEGDRIVTGDGASAQIKMVDGGFIAVRPNTDMGFDTYRYNGKEDGSENAIVSLLHGGFRTITGVIGRTNKQNYTIKTATSTIGIRGTDHEPMVILAPRPGQVAIAPPGTYDKVNVGVAFIRTDAGTIDIQRNQVGFASDSKAPPRVLPNIPPFFKPTPPPGPQKAKDDDKKEGGQTAGGGSGKSGDEKSAGEIRNTAVVDPTSTVSAAPASAINVAPAVAPVIAIVASNASGTTLNATTLLTTACPTCPTTPITQPGTTTGGPTTVGGLTPAVSIAGGSGNFRQLMYASQAIPSGTYTSVYNLASGVVKGASNYLFDASGNLASILSSDYRLSDRGITTAPSYSTGVLPYTGTPAGLPSSPLTGALVTLSGGTAPDLNYNDTVNGVRLGRYAGGTITTVDSSNPTNVASFSTPLGANSLAWALREIPLSIPITGSFEYTPAYATKPTDSLGNVGILNYASLAANFTTQTVTPAVGITINNQNLTAAAANVPLDSSFGFDVSSSSAQNANGGGALRVNCYGSNCAPPPVGISASNGYSGYGGRITGGLAGAGGTAGGAFFRYLFDTYYNPLVAAGSTGGIPTGQTRPVNDYINGVVGFTKGLDVAAFTPATATSGSQAFATAYFSPPSTAGGWYEQYASSHGAASGYTSAFGTGTPNTIGPAETLTGGTVAQAPTNADSFAATGITFGRYSGGTVTGADNLNPSFTHTVQGNYAWIKGPEPSFPVAAMTGTAMYKLDGGTYNGAVGNAATGTITSAVLAVNFNTAAVGVDLQMTQNVASGTPPVWTATTTSTGALTGNPATTLRLGNNGSFFASTWNTGNSGLHESLYVTRTGSVSSWLPGANVGGQINGRLMGSNLSGAGLTYNFQSMSGAAPGSGYNGSVAFALDSYTTAPVAINATGSAVATPTTTTGTSAIDLASMAYQTRVATSGLNAGAAAVDESYLTRVLGSANAVGRTTFGAEGMPTKWDTTSPYVVPASGSGPGYVVPMPVQLSIESASFVGTAALPTGKSAATLLESGFDATTGMRWGRYGGGYIAVINRIDGSATANDISTMNLHAIWGPTQTGPVVLPTAGTYSYTNVGGTKPTDNLGNAGVLNSATLVADFAAQKVSAGVNLSVNGQTWNAGASSIPIQDGPNFGASRTQSGTGTLNVNVCSGAACSTAATIPTTSSANTSGRIAGAFNGSTGKGAGVAYSLNQGGLTGTTVSGVAAFKR